MAVAPTRNLAGMQQTGYDRGMALRPAIKQAALAGAQRLGAMRAISFSRWRTSRLLILCYHGISLLDEHRWNGMYVSRDFFAKRLESLVRKGYNILPLREGVERLRQGELPPRSVAITFDDGFYDFLHHGVPAITTYSAPVTLYFTSYYANHPYPIFNLILSYIFWRGSGKRIDASRWGLSPQCHLSEDTDANWPIAETILKDCRKRGLSAEERNAVAAGLAANLGIDYEELIALRLLQLMNKRELQQAASAGIDIQLHTHRHRVPEQGDLFVREIEENQRWIGGALGVRCEHFCYPSGQYRRRHLQTLRELGVRSATTCDHGLASPSDDPLLLPRFLDSMKVSDENFEGWLSGLSALLPHRRVYGPED